MLLCKVQKRLALLQMNLAGPHQLVKKSGTETLNDRVGVFEELRNQGQHVAVAGPREGIERQIASLRVGIASIDLQAPFDRYRRTEDHESAPGELTAGTPVDVAIHTGPQGVVPDKVNQREVRFLGAERRVVDIATVFEPHGAF
jgi:hypothetical protein